MDAQGPWFDGVAYLQEKQPDEIFVAKAKSQKIGILGGGMSGLMTAHLLDSVGFHDWTIVEASSRMGGRVHTSYLNGSAPEDYQYQEMGPMRFPVSVTYPDTNDTLQINDHRLVFQLADVLNKQNGNDPAYAVEFIKWIQSNPATPSSTSRRRLDGTVPSAADVKADPASYSTNANATYSNATLVAEARAALEKWGGMDEAKYAAFASNVFRAHKQAVEEGYFAFSEAGYLNYELGYDKNITDQVTSMDDNTPNWLYDSVYFSATEWRTIDKGLSRLPAAFGPQVVNRTTFDTAVQGMTYNGSTKKVTIQYRSDNLYNVEPESMEVDYAVVAVPFSRVRLWNPMPSYTSLLSRAIQRLNYEHSCKVSLHYKTRFWEHLPEPIMGGCGSTNIPGIGSICYPSYQINSSGPGVILGSYVSGTPARSLGALTEEQHVALVQRAMIEVHGPIAQEQYTGAHDRICWDTNEFQAGAWAAPLVGQQDLYLPAYFHTEQHTVFVGEHTSYTHAWIFSALESAVRGTAQLLLDMGLVDEAKEITEFWMARWISM
ncbi:L-amino acid oxidase-like protein LaoA [Hortaea werneckii]|nr:L-amino acid oxidase-like protein LaoA [Hortaea werneckii]KAI6829553.1 L-amino acid oxidase-like protein LaoA [Hortaea werneckii]